MLQYEVLRLCDNPATIFDVGANSGDWTEMLLETARRLDRNVRVHAFEPVADTYTKLSARAKDWPSVTAVNKGCSSSSRLAKMTVSKSAPRRNTLVQSFEPFGDTTEDVDLVSIDDYCRCYSIKKIDFLKIDAEGHDYEVIAGATAMLQQNAVSIMQFEYNQRWIASRSYLRDTFSLLAPLGYSIGKIVGRTVEFYPVWHWEMENYCEGNYVACMSEVKAQLPTSQPKWISSEAAG